MIETTNSSLIDAQGGRAVLAASNLVITAGLMILAVAHGIAGLVIAAILAAGMSNLSAALNALASTTVMDFYKPFVMRRDPSRSDGHFLAVARWATIAWGAVLFLIGLVARHVGSVLEAGLSIASILYGSLLGVFLLGLLTKRVQQTSAIIAMMVGLALMIYIRFETSIAFTWYVVIGTGATFSTGYLISLFLKEPEHERTAGVR